MTDFLCEILLIERISERLAFYFTTSRLFTLTLLGHTISKFDPFGRSTVS